MIDRTHDLPIKRQAELLNICRGTVYYQNEPVSQAQLALMRRVDGLHLGHPFAGSRMLRNLLRLAGIEVGRRHVGTLMRRMASRRCTARPTRASGTRRLAPGGRAFQADRGRSGYIHTRCLRASPAHPRRRRFTVHDQTETGAHDR